MPLILTWQDIALRLALTLVAGAVIGFNREAHGHAAGLRTTILVCLAASLAMILANVLLSTRGKGADSFVQIDVMRLPLGILTGVGFIGGGAILRRNATIAGVTTAATLWIVTVIGLCLGSGAIGLGMSGTALGFAVLWALKRVDAHVPRDQRATLTIRASERIPVSEIGALGAQPGCRLRVRGTEIADGGTIASFDVRWQALYDADPPLQILDDIRQRFPGAAVEWRSEAID